MQVTTKAIIISALKYGDTSLIVKAYTLSDGMKSYLVRGVFGKKNSKFKPALFLPLSLVEIVANHKNKGTLEGLREIKVDHPLSQIHQQISKNSLTLFTSEILKLSLQEEEKNVPLFQFIWNAVLWLEQCQSFANFHLCFLIQLSHYLGFYPDTTNEHLPYLDLSEGAFVPHPGINPLIEKNEISLFRSLLGTNFDDSMKIKTSNAQRQKLLHKLLLFYEIHLDGFKKPKSLEVLHAVFN